MVANVLVGQACCRLCFFEQPGDAIAGRRPLHAQPYIL